MKKTLLAIVGTLVVLAGLTGLALVLMARSGSLNVAATEPFEPGAEWFLGTLTRHSIARHARQAADRGEIVPPAEATDAVVHHGASEYAEMCVTCHGAPGVERGEFGKGLKPVPPDLSRSAREMSPIEIYWVVQHGIRHTGMPAFGPTHSSDTLWAITSFVQRMRDMTPEQYRHFTGGASERHGEHTSGEPDEHDHK